MNELNLETAKLDLDKKLMTFFESFGWRADPWEDGEFKSMCMRHSIAEGDMRAAAERLIRENAEGETRRKEREKTDRLKNSRLLT
ncbi:MAG: hypothetical protein AAB731_01480 [Patescibacteria group bacterium]